MSHGERVQMLTLIYTRVRAAKIESEWNPVTNTRTRTRTSFAPHATRRSLGAVCERSQLYISEVYNQIRRRQRRSSHTSIHTYTNTHTRCCSIHVNVCVQTTSTTTIYYKIHIFHAGRQLVEFSSSIIIVVAIKSCNMTSSVRGHNRVHTLTH